MNFLVSDDFFKQMKKLSKKHLSLQSDIENLKTTLINSPEEGKLLGKGVYKIRLKVSSKGKGKSGGARVVYLLKKEESITFLCLYDKSEMENISDKYIRQIIDSL